MNLGLCVGERETDRRARSALVRACGPVGFAMSGKDFYDTNKFKER